MSFGSHGRRAFLRGLGGIVVGLPALEIFQTRNGFGAPPGPRPNRFVMSYAASSIGRDNYGSDMTENMVVPATTGTGYALTRGLKALGELDIQGDVSIVSGLAVPWREQTDTGPVPPGGRNWEFHFNTIGPQLSGMRGPATRDGKPQGETADMIAARALGMTLQPYLAYRVQPKSYEGDNDIGGDAGAQSWKKDPSGELVRVDPVSSPRLAYESLFTDPTLGSSSDAELKKAQFYLRQRKSALDYVANDANRLLPRLGAEDRVRLEQHFAEVRALEKRLEATMVTGGDCKLPTKPGDDPPFGGAIVGGTYDPMQGYSNEDQRAEDLADIVAMAFACDLTRTASFMITVWKCYMNAYPYGMWKSDMHELTHGAGPMESVADSANWCLKQWGRLVKKLKEKKDLDGSNMLDHTAMVLVLEGGHGWDPEGPKPRSAHSTENMVAYIAGRAGGLKPGQHVAAKGQHPAHVVNSALNAVGVPGDLGEVKGNIPALFA
ncbi:MAG: DUF1552 domain-containing protein [Polyangiales bacterium]